eukprot:9072837-Pyramimonas_sp.AAC.2
MSDLSSTHFLGADRQHVLQGGHRNGVDRGPVHALPRGGSAFPPNIPQRQNSVQCGRHLYHTPAPGPRPQIPQHRFIFTNRIGPLAPSPAMNRTA